MKTDGDDDDDDDAESIPSVSSEVTFLKFKCILCISIRMQGIVLH